MTYLHALSGSSRPAGPRHRIVPGVPRPLALEARFMFDGAAAAEVVDAVDVAAKSSADCDEGSQPRAFSVDPNSPKAGITREASWLQIDSNPLEIESIRLAELTKDQQSGHGNDILIELTVQDTTTLFFWVSGEVKEKGETKGYYCWSDPTFKDVDSALTGWSAGNKDPDSNNVGFILALHESDFKDSSKDKGIQIDSAIKSEGLKALLTCSNEVPVAIDDSVTTLEDTAITFGVTGNDSDADGDSMAVTGFTVDGSTYTSGGTATIAGKGALTLNADGTFTFTPVLNFNGTVSGITYTVSDGKGGTASANVVVGVTSVNDAPVATDDAPTTPEDTAVTFGVTGNDSDADGDALTVTSFSVIANNGESTTYSAGDTATIDGGSLTLNTDGTFTFDPDENFIGQVADGKTIRYTVSDGDLTHSASLTLEVTPRPPEPLVFPPPPPPPVIDPQPTAPPAVMESSGGSGGAAAARASFVPPPHPAAERNLVVKTFIREFEVEPHTAGTRLQRFDSAIRPLQYSIDMSPDHLIEPPSRHVHHIDTHTDAPDNDWRTVVHPDTRSQLAVWRGIPDQRVDTDDVAYVSVPWDSFSHTHSDAQVTLDATLADGSPLPLWMNLDPRAGVFELVPPPGLEAELAIRLIARDAEGREAATLFRIQVGERARVLNDGAAPTGRAGLSEQLREATRQSATSRLALPPQYMTAPASHFASHPS